MAEKKIIQEESQRVREDLEDLKMYIESFSAFLPLAVCTLNPLKIILDVNLSFQNLTNYTATEIIGRNIADIFFEKEAIDSLIDRSQKKKKPETEELTLVSKKEKKIPVNASVSARKDKEGNFIGCFLAVTDIAEIKKSREELEEKVKERTQELEGSKKALLNILEDVEEVRNKIEEEKNKTLSIIMNFSDGLMVFDKEQKLSLVNPRAEECLEVKAKEVIGQNLLELARIPNLNLLIEFLGKELKEVYRKELPLKKNITLEASVIPMMSGEESAEFLVILHDVSREKMIEQTKTEFVSISAHQLRTPLSAIKWTLRAILDGDAGRLNPGQIDLLQKTYTSNERMIALVNDLLDVTRIEEGRYLSKPGLADIEPVVQFIINSFKGESERKQISIEFKKPLDQTPKVMLDVEKIKLALQNLVNNAIRYTPDGGKVTISLKHDKKEVEISIKDNGIGIPRTSQQKIFTKFFRGQNAIKMETEGSGLGLFITKNIVEAHGGRIWFESEENKGSTFYIAIPIKEEFEEFLKEF